MKDNLNRFMSRFQSQFGSFTAGQKMVAILGTAALVLAGVMVFKWAAAPSMAPLYSNLASEDASAIIDELSATGVKYEITNNGSTIMVPKADVYATRIALSGEGLPANSGETGGYSLLDEQDISTSQFQEQTDFKRAMEGELAKTVEAIDGVDTAVVHLALPQKQVFADEQAPATASVLVDTATGSELNPEQVQGIVHLVASSIDGLDPAKVTVTDSTGRVLSNLDGTDGAGSSTRDQQVEDYQDETAASIQAMLDRVLGPGNSTVTVTAKLDFDRSVTESTRYTESEANDPLSISSNTETYSGPAAGTGVGGVVGTDGQMDTGTGTGDGSSYNKESVTQDNPVDVITETRETAPGTVESQNVAVVLDAAAARNIDPGEVEALVSSAIGAQPKRDSVMVSTMTFDRSAEAAAAAELKAANSNAKQAEMMDIYKKGGLALLVALLLLIVWFKGRRRNKARANATTMVVEQLRLDQATRTQAVATAPAMAALERAEHSQSDDMKAELTALVERQPEDVAALLRGWLVER